MPEIPGEKLPEREGGTDGTRQCSCSNFLAFIGKNGSNLAIFGLVSVILFKTNLLVEMLALSLVLAILAGNSWVCIGNVQVKL